MRRALLPLALSALVGACGLPAGDIDSGVGAPDPTWEADIAPLVDAHCVRCHAAAGRMSGGVDLSSYSVARSTRVTSVCTSVNQEVIDAFAEHLVPLGGTASGPCADLELLSMPPGATPRLSLYDQVTYARWVALGAPER